MMSNDVLISEMEDIAFATCFKIRLEVRPFFTRPRGKVLTLQQNYDD